MSEIEVQNYIIMKTAPYHRRGTDQVVITAEELRNLIALVIDDVKEGMLK